MLNHPYALIPLFSSTIGTFLAAYIFSKNRKSTKNRLYLLVGIVSSIHCLVEMGYIHGTEIEQFEIIRSFDFVWPFNLVAMLYFTASITDKMKWMFKVEGYILVIGSSSIFAYVSHSSNYIREKPDIFYKIYTIHLLNSGNFMDTAAQIWMIAIESMIVIAPLSFLKKKEDPRKRGLAKTVTVAHLTTIAYFLVSSFSEKTNFQIIFPTPLSFSVSIWLITYAYAIWKYELFVLSPVTTAQEIVAKMTDALFLINPDRTISMGNKAAAEMFGWSEKEIKSMPIAELFHEKTSKPQWIENNKHSPNQSIIGPSNIETVLNKKDGCTVPVSLASSRLQTKSGYMMGYLILARNISSRIKRDEELNQYRYRLEQLVNQRTKQLLSSNRQLETETLKRIEIENERASLEEQLQHAQKMDAVGRLAGGIAHDFNNLLFIILGYTEDFIEKIDKNDSRIEELEEISEAAKRASYLTKQLLAFSRKQIATPETIKPEETLDRAHKMLKRLIGEDIKIEFRKEEELGYLYMDPGQLDQILVNLTVNARDAMSHGGTLNIELKNYYIDKNNEKKHLTRNQGKYILLSVSDTGHGMSDETRKKIFEPFFTTKGKGKGTGLGLSTVYGIVRQNGGFIEVNSNPGRGTTFAIFLPKFRKKIKMEKELSVLPQLSNGETILLVEDEEQVRKLASRLLTNRGYTVVEAKNAIEAIKLFHEKNKKIDLLLTDVMMPDMNGKQLSEELLNHSPSLKILFMSGYNEDMEDGIDNLGSNTPLLLKPFTSRDLSNKIRKILNRTERQTVH